MEVQDVTQVMGQVVTYLEALAQKLGVGVGKIWPWFVKQQYVEGVRATIVFAAFLSAFLFTWRKATKMTWGKEISPVGGMVIAMFIIFGIGTAIAFIDFAAEFPDMFNPEYWAFKNILNMVKPSASH